MIRLMARQSLKRWPVVMLATADWDNPFWTNKQHTAVELVNQGCRLFYIESLGLRQPTLKAADRSRMMRRLLRACMPPRRVHSGLWVWSPLLVPQRLAGCFFPLNLLLLNISLHAWLWLLGFRRPLLWTYNPLTLSLLKRSLFRGLVYHCVDDIKAQPGMNRRQIAKAEVALLRDSDVVFTTSQALQKRAVVHNRQSFYYPNVVDVDHFCVAREVGALPIDLSSIPSPRLGFVGAISGYKLDFRLLADLAERQPGWHIVMIGAVGEGDPWTDLSALRDLPNVHFLGPKAYGDLPHYLRGFDCALLPCRHNAYTRAMFPMKFFEYLAAGVPVVSVSLPALAEFRHLASFVEGADGFERAILDALECAKSSSMSISGGSVGLDQIVYYSYERRTAWMLEKLQSLHCISPQASSSSAPL
jgi:glycosyltransferase involved in cell wall biosynthesis